MNTVSAPRPNLKPTERKVPTKAEARRSAGRNWRSAGRLLEAGALDIALVTLPIRASRATVATQLAVDPLLALLPKALAPDAPSVNAAQLAGLPLILYEVGSNTRKLVDDWFARANVAASPIMELGSVEAIKVLVASGLGASILPRLALKAAARTTVVCPLRPALARDLAYVLRKDKVIDRGLRVFLDELARVAGKPASGGIGAP